MNAQSVEIIDIPHSELLSTNLSVHLTKVSVTSEDTCRLAMAQYNRSRSIQDYLESLESGELRPHKEAMSSIKERYLESYRVLDEFKQHCNSECVAFKEAQAAFDEPVEIKSSYATFATRKSLRVRVIDKQKIPEAFKVVDEQEILRQYKRGGAVIFGISSDGSYEVYEEEIEYLKTK